MKLKLAYFGTPDFSASFLEKILTDKDIDLEVALVVTQPDQPVGRNKIMTSSPVKVLAKKNKIPVFHNLSELLTTNYQLLNNLDFALVYAYGTIIPKNILQLLENGFWNIHPSLLPRYRGPSPTSYPLILGDKTTGVTLMKMDEEMDHGPIIDQVEYEIPSQIRRPELESQLTDLGFELFKNRVTRYTLQVTPRVQDHGHATYTSLFKKEDGFIALSVLKKALNNEPLASEEIPTVIVNYLERNKQSISTNINTYQHISSSKIVYDCFRGLDPWPGIWTNVSIKGSKRRLKITDVSFDDESLLIKRVQLEGKTEVDFQTFEDAYQIFTI